MHASRFRIGSFFLLLCAVLALSLVTAQERPRYRTWQVDKGSADSSNYSALAQINRSNVNQLQVAWTFPTGDEVLYTFNPLIVDRMMYVLAHDGAITAIDAGTARELWKWEPPTRGTGRRGINYWESQDRSDRRILSSYGNYLYAIDAQHGTTIPSFGHQGRVSLKEGLGRDSSTILSANTQSAGKVFENLIILGSTTGEQYVSSSPGDIRAFDVRSGHLVWSFHTIPHPGEFGYESWPKDAWQYTGGTNNWGEMSVDEARGIVYLPTGSPTYDFYGGDRPGNNLFGNSLLALDARTGKRLWHYQIIHHDIWDYDMVSAPQLVTIRQNGKLVDVVVTAGKNGLVFVFDRVTGKPIWPIEERPVPKGDVPGEWYSPTQPFPTKPPPLQRIDPISPDEVNPYVISDEERARFRDMIANARNEGIYTPPALNRWAVHRPGHSGGSNLYSTSSDPTTGTVYIASWGGPSVLRLETSEAATANNGTWGPRASDAVGAGPGADRQASSAVVQQGRVAYDETCDSCHGNVQTGGGTVGVPLIGITKRLSEDAIRSITVGGQGRMPPFSTMSAATLDALMAYLRNPGPAATPRPETPYPVGVTGPAPQRFYSGYGFAPLMLAPPWSTYTAYDMNTGTIKWRIPVGDAIGPNLPPGNNFGEAMIHGPKSTLTITAGGLAFAGTRDRKFRAYDKDTGKVLWSADLPGMSMGVPSVYEIDGREHVVVHAVGSWIAYALPKQ